MTTWATLFLPPDVTLGLLLGDINGDGLVDCDDSHETKLDRGQATDSDNFREDINANGHIDADDFAMSKHSSARCCRREHCDRLSWT